LVCFRFPVSGFSFSFCSGQDFPDKGLLTLILPIVQVLRGRDASCRPFVPPVHDINHGTHGTI
jgi:hypothetical protein